MIQAICWTLVHSLWQGLFFALIAGGAMLLTRQASAALRYNMVCIIFFLFLAVCAGTFLYELAGALPGEAAAVAAADSGSRMAAWIDALGKYCSEHAVLIVWGWLFVFTIKSLHMLGSYLYTQRVRHYGINVAPGGWQERVDQLCRQMGIQRTVRLVESQIVKMPMVIGHLRPMILMPLGLIMGLPHEEIEAVLLHELAHIRRNDYIVNFIQNVAVNFFFFNPGLLWMSSLLREERENCCDDIAIARTHDRAGFIRALISFKEHDLRLAGVANGFPGKKNQLVKRVMRIAQNTNKTLDPVEKIFLAISFVLISVLVAATSGSSSSSPVKVTQIPGGKYRFFVDTPARPVQEPLLQHPKREGTAQPIVYKEEPDQEIKARQEATPKETAVIDEDRQQPEDIAAMENEVQAKKMVIDAKTVQDDEQSLEEKKLATDAAVQAFRDKQQAQRDAEQAVRDKRQADLDRQQAIRDRKQAERDAQQAVLDKIQAERDAHQALLDKAQALKDKSTSPS
ncbi:MAG TPA: M56 family metallopeptidase [Puia sp.]